MKHISSVTLIASLLFTFFAQVKSDLFVMYSLVGCTLLWEILIVARYLLRDKELAAFTHDGGYKTLGPNIGTVGFLLVFSQLLMFIKVDHWGQLSSDSYTLFGIVINTKNFAIILGIVFSLLNLHRFRTHQCRDLLWSSLATIWLVVPLGIASSNFLSMTIPVVFLAGNQGPDHFNPIHIKGGEKSLRLLKTAHSVIITFYAMLALWVTR